MHQRSILFHLFKNNNPPVKDGCWQVTETRTKLDKSKIWPLTIVASEGKMGQSHLDRSTPQRQASESGHWDQSATVFKNRDHVAFESLPGGKCRSPVTDLHSVIAEESVCQKLHKRGLAPTQSQGSSWLGGSQCLQSATFTSGSVKGHEDYMIQF